MVLKNIYNSYLKLHVQHKFSGIINLNVANTSNGAEIKLKALQQTQHDQNQIQEDENWLKKFKLIRVKTKSLFEDNCVLETSDIEDKEEFLLLQKRTDSILNLDQDQEASPSANEVFQRTKHIPITQSSTTPAFNLDNLLAQSDVS